jgi:ubiquinone/menaquinone biosynthesis C-methylase UbiE
MTPEPPLFGPAFFRIHENIPREGPGDAESTRRAFRMLRLPDRPDILDLGCGPGLQTIELARLTNGHIKALDLYDHYLQRVEQAAGHAGVQSRVATLQGSMFDLRFPDESFDVVWAEGSIYIIGFERGLREWKRLLRPKGYVAATHLSWLTNDIPREAEEFWAKTYPAIASVEDNLRIARQEGYEVVGEFPLPTSAWWNEYYGPLETRLADLRQDPEFKDDPIARQSIAATQEEIDLYRKYPDVYGYVFYVMRRRVP